MILIIWATNLIINKLLDLVKQKRFYPYEYKNDFEKFKEELSSKENFHSSLTCKN